MTILGSSQAPSADRDLCDVREQPDVRSHFIRLIKWLFHCKIKSSVLNEVYSVLDLSIELFSAMGLFQTQEPQLSLLCLVFSLLANTSWCSLLAAHFNLANGRGTRLGKSHSRPGTGIWTLARSHVRKFQPCLRCQRTDLLTGSASVSAARGSNVAQGNQ